MSCTKITRSSNVTTVYEVTCDRKNSAPSIDGNRPVSIEYRIVTPQHRDRPPPVDPPFPLVFLAISASISADLRPPPRSHSCPTTRSFASGPKFVLAPACPPRRLRFRCDPRNHVAHATPPAASKSIVLLVFDFDSVVLHLRARTHRQHDSSTISSSGWASPPLWAGSYRSTPLQRHARAPTTLHSARNTSVPSYFAFFSLLESAFHYCLHVLYRISELQFALPECESPKTKALRRSPQILREPNAGLVSLTMTCLGYLVFGIAASGTDATAFNLLHCR